MQRSIPIQFSTCRRFFGTSKIRNFSWERAGPLRPKSHPIPLYNDGVNRLAAQFDVSVWNKSHNCLLPPEWTLSNDLPYYAHIANLPDPSTLVSVEDLIKCGAMYGHKATEWNPRMKPFILGERKGYHIIDLYQTVAALRNVGRTIQYLTLEGGTILFTCYNPTMKTMVDYYARKCDSPFMIDFWRPGFWTNFDEVMRNSCAASRLSLKPRETGILQKQRKVLRRRYAVEGFTSLCGPPDMVFFANSKKCRSMMRESNKAGIPTVGVVDTDQDPTDLMYPVPCNDENLNAIQFITKFVSDCIRTTKDYRHSLKMRYGLEFGDYLDTIPKESLQLNRIPIHSPTAPRKL